MAARRQSWLMCGAVFRAAVCVAVKGSEDKEHSLMHNAKSIKAGTTAATSSSSGETQHAKGSIAAEHGRSVLTAAETSAEKEVLRDSLQLHFNRKLLREDASALAKQKLKEENQNQNEKRTRTSTREQGQGSSSTSLHKQTVRKKQRDESEEVGSIVQPSRKTDDPSSTPSVFFHDLEDENINIGPSGRRILEENEQVNIASAKTNLEQDTEQRVHEDAKIKNGYAAAALGQVSAEELATLEKNQADGGFSSAFLNALGMIFATEIGDRTFFIAAVMAMSNPRIVVFSGAIGALALMTILSAILGHAVPHLLPKVLTHWASVVLLLYFGVKMLLDARQMYLSGEGKEVSEELEEVEHELAEKGLATEMTDPLSMEGSHTLGKPTDPEFGLDLESQAVGVDSMSTTAGESNVDEDREKMVSTSGSDTNTDVASPRDLILTNSKPGASPSGGTLGARNSGTSATSPRSRAKDQKTTPQILTQSFILTFVAEWGDRSQIATIALAAAQNPYGVTLGAIIGHSICTGFAVIGGKILAKSITERQVALSGGILFLLFAGYTVYVGVQE
ncbi:unnamed protein product [Amoebophrya sp. A120]|nr:unnamed protein product [Amoebophrya sp. A120]|eukprot:GSA120T00015961001.1